MRKLLSIILLAIFLGSFSAFAQDINIYNTDGTPYEIDCDQAVSETITNVRLYDDGGASGQYETNRSYYMTLNSNNGGYVYIKFTQFSLAQGTIMSIKNEVTGEMLISNASGTSLNGMTFTSYTGSITIIWTSGSTTGVGFAAKVWCGHACQRFSTNINISDISPTNDGKDVYYDVCQKTQVQFSAINDFYENGQNGYTQDDNNLTYDWVIVNSWQDTTRLSGQNPAYSITKGGDYFIICNSKDQQECYNQNSNRTHIRASLSPTWSVSISVDSVCSGYQITMSGEPSVKGMYKINRDTTLIPDGTGECYNSVVSVNAFDDDATITSTDDIERIYINMEHSFIGDISIMIQCPNGQNCLLRANNSSNQEETIAPNWTNTGGINIEGSSRGNNLHLGLSPDPVESSSCYLVAGEGYSYNFTPTSTNPFGMIDGTTPPYTSTTYTDPCDNTETNMVMDEGNYGSYESMVSLIGCPLNGEWILYVCDHSAQDNGYVFEWAPFFREDLYLYPYSFCTNYEPSYYSWSGVGMQSGENGSTYASASVQNPDPDNYSSIPYTFSATDNFGCSYDTTIVVHVKPSLHEDCCLTPTPTASATDTQPCELSTTLVASQLTYQGNTGEWTYTGPGTATFTNENQPITDVSVNVEGDYTFTWHEYYFDNLGCTGEASVNVNFARAMDATLAPIDNCCHSASVIQLYAQNFGTLSCSPSSDALNPDAHSFTPRLAIPGTYTITNTITDERCATPSTHSVTFEVFDEIVISNRTEMCDQTDPEHPMVDVTFNLNGVTAGSDPPAYNVTGTYTENSDNQYGTAQNGTVSATNQTSNTFSFSQYSAVEYALIVSDTNSCSSVSVAGYYACYCPYNAGVFADYSPHILCTGETYPVGTQAEGNAGAGTFSYIICTDPNDILNSWVSTLPGDTETIALGTFSGQNDIQYYLVAVEGNGEGLNAWTSGCRSVSQAVPLMWKQTPAPSATGAESCGLVMQLNGSVVPDGMCGYWTATPPEGVNNYSYTTIENTMNTMNTPTVLSSHYGNVTFTWHIVNAECEDSASAVYKFHSIPQPNAGSDMAVCGLDAVINDANASDAPDIENSTLLWTCAGVTFDENNTLSPQVNANISGTFQLKLTEYNGECAGSDYANITFVNSVPKIATLVDTVCGHTAELQVFNANSADDGYWSVYDINYNVLPTVSYSNFDDATTLSDNTHPHCYVTVPIPDDQTEIEYIFRWTEEMSDPRLSESCVGQDEEHVVFRKLPIISVHQCGSTGNNMSVCGNTVEICAETMSSDGYTDFAWVCNENLGYFEDSLSNSTTFTLDSSVLITRYQDVEFYFVGRNSTCMAIDTMHVRFLQRPYANAGVDGAVCGNSYELNGVWSLQPSEDYTPTCQWIVGEKPDPMAVVTWNNTPHDSIVEGVQVSDYGVYKFVLREMNSFGQSSTCYDQDTVRVEFMEIPIVNAGRDTIFCGLDFQLNAVSSQDDNNNISGTWTSMSSGSASFADSTDSHTTGHYSDYGLATFRWTETNQSSIETDDVESCSAYDEVVVTFYEPPTAVINITEADTVVCGLVTPFLLRAEEPGDGIGGFWYDENQSTQFGENNQTVNSIFTDARVSSYGRHDFYWIEYTGPSDNPHLCTDTAGPWTINFIQIAEILEDQFKFCTSDGQLSAVPTETGEGSWPSSIPDVITFDEPNNPNTAVHAAILNNENSPYTIYWTVLDGSCLTKDSINVTFGDVPKYFIDTTVSNFVTIGDHTFYSTGNYTFSMPSETGCDTIYDLQLRVLAEPVYDIAPNPTSKMLNINSDGFISSVEFYSVTGQLVMRKEVNGYEAEFDVEGLADGMYILRIYGEESSLPSMYKIIKE